MALLTVRVAAKRMGIAYSTLKQWIYQGNIRTTQTAGGHYRLSEVEIERFLARQRPMDHAMHRADGPVTLIVALSGRNRLRGYVDEVRVDGVVGQVKLRIGDQSLTAIITRDAIEELHLKRGDDVVAIVKSTDVMIARSQPSEPPKRHRRRR